MSSPLDRALQDRLTGPLTGQRMVEAAIRRVQHQKREIIVLEDTPVHTRVGNRMSPVAAVGRANKTRMDILSSDIYAPEKYDSDDSLPDLGQSFGLPNKFSTKGNTAPAPNNETRGNDSRVLVSSRETIARINREVTEETTTTGVARMKAYLERNLTRPSQENLTRSASISSATIGGNIPPPTVPTALQMFLDPISSSSPLPSLPRRPNTHRAPSFHRGATDIEPIISSSPPVAAQRPTAPRTTLHRANTFHSIPSDPVHMDRQSLSQPSYYHEMSDDDEDLRTAILASQNSVENEYDEEEALKAAIAASLAEGTPKQRMQPQTTMRPAGKPSQVQPYSGAKTSLFQNPDELFGPLPSSPPEVEVLDVEVVDTEVHVSQREVYQEVQRAPRPSPPSRQVRQDTKRMLDALDYIGLNALKRKNEDKETHSTKKSSKKAAVENGENPRPRKRAVLTQEEKDSRAAVQSDKQAAKEAKRLEKERLAREKADQQRLDALNRLKTRKEACPELIAYIPHTLPDALHDAILSFLEPLGIDTREWHPQIPNLIKFVRKVRVEWDSEGMLFRPCEERKEEEKWIVQWMSAEEFIEMAGCDTGIRLDLFVRRLRGCIPGAMPIIVIEGLAREVKKQKTAEKRAHDKAVRQQLGNDIGNRSNRTAISRETARNIDEEVLENALIEIQLQHEVRIIQTEKSPESAEWISILATDIASIPYKQTKMYLDRSFCMESGQFKSGSTVDDTYHKMLQQIHRVTPQIADAITGTYKSVHSLISAFKRDGPFVLEGLQPRLTGTGTVRQRGVGQAMSRRVYEVFLGRNQFALA